MMVHQKGLVHLKCCVLKSTEEDHGEQALEVWVHGSVFLLQSPRIMHFYNTVISTVYRYI